MCNSNSFAKYDKKTNEASFDYTEFPAVIANFFNVRNNVDTFTAYEVKNQYRLFFDGNLPGDILRYFTWEENDRRSLGYEIIRDSVVIKNLICDIDIV